MKFLIEYAEKPVLKTLTYDIADCSFDTEPLTQEINFDVVVNRLNLTAAGDENKIVQVWGFSGYNEWVQSDFSTPQSRTGVLKVINDLEGGLAYKVSKEDLPVYVNTKTGWVCIGSPEINGNAVEFINNCVAVIDENEEFVSLWLKPESLPWESRQVF